MIILTLRTDKPETELGLFDGDKKLAYINWAAHRQLAETLHKKIKELLKEQAKDLPDIQGIVMYEGPGSFTGLRIGISVGNALAYSYNIPAIGMSSEDWIHEGISKLNKERNTRTPVIPKYGSEAHTTVSKK